MDCDFSFGPNGAFFAKSDTIWAWSDNNTLPEPLRLILEDPNHPQANKFPYDVAFAMEPGIFCMSWKTVHGDDYFEELFLGPRYSKLAEFMRNIARKGEHCTRTVFGPNTSYFTISPSGYSWQNLPPALETDIMGRMKKGHPTTVALGVHGSFVVLYSDGNVSFEVAEHYPAVDAMIRNSAENSRRKGIEFIALSPYSVSQYYVAFGDGSASWNIPTEWTVDVTTVTKSLRPVASDSTLLPPLGGFSAPFAGFGGTAAAGGISAAIQPQAPASPSTLSTGLHAIGDLGHAYQAQQQQQNPGRTSFATSIGNFDLSTLADGLDLSALAAGLSFDPIQFDSGREGGPTMALSPSVILRNIFQLSRPDPQDAGPSISSGITSQYEPQLREEEYRQPRGEEDLRYRTQQQHSSSTSSSTAAPSNIQIEESVGAESNASPQDASDANISTFVIYAPNEISNGHASITPDDIQVIEKEFPDGGLVLSVHRPTQAEAWVEDHYDDNVFETARSSGFGGPIATMLSPGVAALVIFGSILDDWILSFARTLANVSGFAVMIRPVNDDPTPKFSEPDDLHEDLLGTWSTPDFESENDGAADDDRVDFEEEDGSETVPNPRNAKFEGPAWRLRGGGDGSDEDDISIPGMSKVHRAVVWLNLQQDEEPSRTLSVRTHTTFQLQSGYTKFEPRPQVIGRIWLTVETPAKILPDRSYSSLGFLAHRENSIVHREFMNSENPDQTLKTIDQTSTGLAVGLNAGYPATVAATATYNRGAAKTVELADNKPIPKCHIIPDPGERWNKDGKSYISYDITTVPKEDPRSGIRHPLHAQFAMGINVYCPKANPKLPKISFVTRNQVIVWISDATMKSKVRGLLVLMTTFIPNIRTPEELFVQEQLDVHFQTNVTVENTAAHQPSTTEEAMPLSLSLAAIETTKSRQNRLTELFTDVRRKVTPKKRPALADLPLQEYISRGWDPDNGSWRDVIWTSLDKDFRITELEKAQTTPVWKLGWKPCKQEDDSDLDETEMPLDAVATENPHGGPGGAEPGAEIEEVAQQP
ncbi:hypothetical protein K438DRAFT_1836409 [Mycena galopus ATCC 62051]|nr:hypothetical protein K438DRAFT_1836409 [Mycena galopus ATCC 62051]